MDIPHIITDRAMMPADGKPYMAIFAHVDKSYRPKNGCPYCHSDDLKLEGTTAPRLIHDVDRNNLRIDIVLQPPRMSCKTCRNKFTVNIEGISGSRQMTSRLKEYLRKECFLQPFSKLSERSGLSIYTIMDIMDEEIAKYEAERKANPPLAPRVLGIDEKHISHDMRGTLVDIETGKLLDMMADNKKTSMISAIKALKDWEKIEVVTVDMNNAYVSWLTKELPNATIVIDRFHVVKNVEKSIRQCWKVLLEYRRKKIKENPDIDDKARQTELLRLVTKYNKIFQYSSSRLSIEANGERMEQLSTIVKEFPEFKMLHNLHAFVDYLYAQTSREDAEKVWDDWYDIMPPGGPKQYEEWCDLYMFPPELFDCWRSFSRYGFLRFKPYILNYFNSEGTRVTNAATEGINSLIQDINVAGKGYSFERLRAKCLYASVIYERTIFTLDLKTVSRWSIPDARMSFMLRFGAPQEMSFVSTVKKCSIPSVNIYGNNSWLMRSLSYEHYKAQEEFLYSVKEMDKRNELDPMPEPAIYTLELEE